jgi:hypothetical protein
LIREVRPPRDPLEDVLFHVRGHLDGLVYRHGKVLREFLTPTDGRDVRVVTVAVMHVQEQRIGLVLRLVEIFVCKLVFQVTDTVMRRFCGQSPRVLIDIKKVLSEGPVR